MICKCSLFKLAKECVACEACGTPRNVAGMKLITIEINEIFLREDARNDFAKDVQNMKINFHPNCSIINEVFIEIYYSLSIKFVMSKFY